MTDEKRNINDDELEKVSGGISGAGGTEMGSMFRNATAGLEKDGQALRNKIDELSSKDGVNQKDLLEMQFAMGQYNAKLENMSSVTKSLQDMLKSLDQNQG